MESPKLCFSCQKQERDVRGSDSSSSNFDGNVIGKRSSQRPSKVRLTETCGGTKDQVTGSIVREKYASESLVSSEAGFAASVSTSENIMVIVAVLFTCFACFLDRIQEI